MSYRVNMPMRQKQRTHPCLKCYRSFLEYDRFGEQINFNIDHRTHYNTGCGVVCTIAILVITVATFYFALMRGMKEQDVPLIVKQVRSEYFQPGRDVYQVRQDSEKEPFAFAIALSSYARFKDQDNTRAGKFNLVYRI